MSDPDQPGEELDEAVGDEDYPPTRFQDGDDLDQTEPEVWERDRADDDEPEIELLGDDAGVPDEEDELVAEVAEDEQDTRDVASEHVPQPAEEAAVHIDEDL